MKSRRGQESFGISFGVIFSVIIIIFIVAVAIYAIVHFLNLNKCAQVGMFFDELQKEIDKAWQSQFYNAPYDGTLPSSGLLKSGAEYVCFGTETQQGSGGVNDDKLKDELFSKYFANQENNVFIYPPDKVCGGEFFSTKLKHVDFNPVETNFFCQKITDGKVPITIQKSSEETLVKITATGT